MASVYDIRVPYEEYDKLVKDSTQLANVKVLLATEFPDDTCQMIAIKSMLGIEEVEEEPTDPTDPPTDPTDPTTPPTGDPSGTP